MCVLFKFYVFPMRRFNNFTILFYTLHFRLKTAQRTKPSGNSAILAECTLKITLQLLLLALNWPQEYCER